MSRCFCVVVMLAALLLAAPSEGNARALSPPLAQAMLDEGVAAATQRDYPTAVARFKDAANLAGYQPILLFNLGLATSKIPGQDLRALAWFEAYLDAAPDAANASAVRAQTNAIAATYEAKLRTILDRLESLSRQFKAVPTDNLGVPGVSAAEMAKARKSGFDFKALHLAQSRFLLDDVGGAQAILRANFGESWGTQLRKRSEDHDKEESALYKGVRTDYLSPSEYAGFRVDEEDEVATAMIAAGLFDEGMRQVVRLYDPDSIAFALESGDVARAQPLVESGSHYTWLASACFAAQRGDMALLIDAVTRAAAVPNVGNAGLVGDLLDVIGTLVFIADRVGNPDVAKSLRARAEVLAASITDAKRRQIARDFLSRARVSTQCYAYRWSTDMRRRYLITVALRGRMLNDKYDDTHIPELFSSDGYPVDSDHFGYASSALDGLILFTSRLADTYRKVRGPRPQ